MGCSQNDPPSAHRISQRPSLDKSIEDRKNDTLISIEHFAEAQFITITNSKEVFAQISTIIGQSPKLDNDPVSMTFKESSEWSVIACTNGQISTIGIDYIIDSLSTPRTQNRSTSSNTQNRGFSWYVQRSYLPKGYKHNKIEPLWKNPRQIENKIE